VRPFKEIGLKLGPLAGPVATGASRSAGMNIGATTDQDCIRQLSRRDFLKSGGVFVIGVSLGVSVLGCGRESAPVTAAPVATGPWSPDVFVSFDPDGTVHIISHRSEMGQGIRTGLPAVLADEMEADWARVVVEQATGDAKYGNQNTDGSWSVRGFMQRMREAGATVRQMLVQSAANQWGVDPAECRAELHTVVHGASGRVLDYRDLVAGAAELPVPAVETLSFKPREQWRYIGKELPIVDLQDMTHGRANYGADTRLPGMKFAAVARPPVVFGKVKTYNADAALAVAGVEQVVEIPAAVPPANYRALGGLAVIADNSWAALKARDLLTIEWEDGANAGTIRQPTSRLCWKPCASPARPSATRATRTWRWPPRRAAWRRSTTPRCWRMPRWSRRPRWPRSRPTPAKSGRQARTRSR
jgi:isoquinoline 1-oxidoreductase beta subunit